MISISMGREGVDVYYNIKLLTWSTYCTRAKLYTQSCMMVCTWLCRMCQTAMSVNNVTVLFGTKVVKQHLDSTISWMLLWIPITAYLSTSVRNAREGWRPRNDQLKMLGCSRVWPERAMEVCQAQVHWSKQKKVVELLVSPHIQWGSGHTQETHTKTVQLWTKSVVWLLPRN